MQFLAGVYLFVGLAWLGSFNSPPLYMTALAFTAYGVHWWAIGLSRAMGGDGGLNGFMSDVGGHSEPGPWIQPPALREELRRGHLHSNRVISNMTPTHAAR